MSQLEKIILMGKVEAKLASGHPVRISAAKMYWFTFLLLMMVVTIPTLLTSLFHDDEGLPFTWKATTAWIDSAACAKSTGMLLIGCPDGRPVPFAEISRADDPGHALILGVYSLVTKKDVFPRNISQLNTLINYAGISAIILLLLFLDLKVAALISLLLLPPIDASYHAISPHPAQMGAALLSAILPLSLLRLDSDRPRTRAAWVLAGMIALAASMLLRESIGLMGIAASIITLLSLAWHSRRSIRGMIGVGVVAIGLVMALLLPSILERTRDMIYHLPAATLVGQHGIWHALFVGLGAVPNDLGIVWQDQSGFDYARRIDPSVVMESPHYFDILRAAYLHILASQPLDVVSIYSRKLYIALCTPLLPPWGHSPLWAVLGLCAGLHGMGKLRSRLPTPAAAVAIVAVCFCLMFLAQAALIHQSIQYLFPIGAFLVLLAAVSLENRGLLEALTIGQVRQTTCHHPQPPPPR